MQYLLTERAHLMCPHMCFGVVLSVPRAYDEARIRDTMARLAAAHPFLNALLGYETARNAYYYRITERAQAELLPKGTEVGAVDSAEIMEEYRRLTGREWNLFEEGMLKVAAWRMGGSACFLMVFHHLLADGRGALGLAEEWADCYAADRSPAAAPERLIASANDLPADSRMPLISRFLVDRANKSWVREGHLVSYREYLAFADAFLQDDTVRYSVVRMGPDELAGVRERCHEAEVTVNDYLLARMMIEKRTGKIVMACDLRDRLSVYRPGALGNYATAFSVEVRAKTDDLFELARAAHAQVQKKMARPSELYLVLQCYAAMEPGLLDAALMACRGGFPSKAGQFIGSAFFGFGAARGHSVTNLGKIESGNIGSAFFVPPASPAMRATWGALTVNGTLTICSAERAAK